MSCGMLGFINSPQPTRYALSAYCTSQGKTKKRGHHKKRGQVHKKRGQVHKHHKKRGQVHKQET